jgi:hypothetical protein
MKEANGENKPIRAATNWLNALRISGRRMFFSRADACGESQHTRERRSTRLRSSTWSDASRGSAKWLPLG